MTAPEQGNKIYFKFLMPLGLCILWGFYWHAIRDMCSNLSRLLLMRLLYKNDHRILFELHVLV